MKSQLINPTKQLYIRPVFKVRGPSDNSSMELTAVAVCTTNGQLHVDEQVDAWFEADASGAEIREWYKDNEFTELTWGNTLTYQGT